MSLILAVRAAVCRFHTRASARPLEAQCTSTCLTKSAMATHAPRASDSQQSTCHVSVPPA